MITLAVARADSLASSSPVSLGTETTKALNIELGIKRASEQMQTAADVTVGVLQGTLSSPSKGTHEAAPGAGRRAAGGVVSKRRGLPGWGLGLSLWREIQGEGFAFHSCFGLQTGTGQGSKEVPNVIQGPWNFIYFPLFHPGVHNVTILLLLSF